MGRCIGVVGVRESRGVGVVGVRVKGGFMGGGGQGGLTMV